MTLYIHGRPERVVRRRRTALVIVLALVGAGLVGWQLAGGAGAPGAGTAAAAVGREGAAPGDEGAAGSGDGRPGGAERAGSGEGDRDDDAAARAVREDAALAGVDAELARRFVRAQAAAAADGVALRLTSGRRTAAEQQALVDAAVQRYGSTKEAHRWVLPPGASAHVKGLALDVGPTAGALWLGEHGLTFGLCRTYANEVWHFEKLPAGRDSCAAMHPDSSSGW